MDMQEKLNKLYEKKNEMIDSIKIHTRSLSEFKQITCFTSNNEHKAFCSIIEKKEETLRILMKD